MQDLQIRKTIIDNKEVNSIEARRLYEKLEVQSKFADWIKNRLKDFQINIDYISVSNFLENGGKSIDYTLSIETAKHIAMIERNEQGRKIRQYFIDFEEKARQPLQLTHQQQALLLAKSLIEANETINTLTIKNDAINTKIEEITNTDDNYTFRHFAKKVNVKENQLRDFLIFSKLINYNISSKMYMPTAKAINKGFIFLKTVEFKKGDYSGHKEEVRYTQIMVDKFLKNIEVFNKFVLAKGL